MKREYVLCKNKRQELGFSVFNWILIAFLIITGLGVLIHTTDNKPQKSKVGEIYDDPMFFCENNVKHKLRDPSSYEKIQVLLPEKVSDNEKILRWDFRSKNGFGGYNTSTAECFISKEGRGSLKTKIIQLK